MTVVDDQTALVELEDENQVEPGEDTGEGTPQEPVSKRDHDYTRFRELHQNLADYFNKHSGLAPLTPNQVKAFLILRADYNDSPDKVENRERKRAEKEAEKAKYAGLTEAQIKAQKAAAKAEAQAKAYRARFDEAMAKAKALRDEASASGEDLAAVVAEQTGNGSDEATGRRSRNRR